MTVLHASFTIERTLAKHSVDRVFEAFKNPEKRRRWFVEGEGFTIHDYTLDFRVGAREEKHGAGTKLTYTEQGAFIDGTPDDVKNREAGTGELLGALEKELNR